MGTVDISIPESTDKVKGFKMKTEKIDGFNIVSNIYNAL